MWCWDGWQGGWVGSTISFGVPGFFMGPYLSIAIDLSRRCFYSCLELLNLHFGTSKSFRKSYSSVSFRLSLFFCVYFEF